MNVILVDDEQLALKLLEKQLKQLPQVEIIGQYQDANEAINEILLQRPHAVFLDINMPETNGLEVAERLLEQNPQLEIVFVTAYDDYAIQAFELNAIDYLLKPVQAERLAKTIERLQSKIKEGSPLTAVDSRKTHIQCLHHLKVISADGEVSWRISKGKELFAFLVHHRNTPVQKDLLLETLWPHLDIDKAYAQLYTAVYQLRKNLQQLNSDLHIENKYSNYLINTELVTIDVEKWEKSLSSLPPLSVESVNQHMAIFNSYIGDYFEEHDYLWAEAERERLRTMWYQHALRLSDVLIEANSSDLALQVLSRLKTQFPFSEQIYFSIMKYYYHVGNAQLVKETYRQLIIMLDSEYGISPQQDTIDWYAKIFNNRDTSTIEKRLGE